MTKTRSSSAVLSYLAAAAFLIDAAAGHAQPNSADLPAMPWPAQLKPAADASCTVPEQRVRAGYALEEDFWTNVNCLVHRLGTPQQQQQFIDSVRAYHASSQAFKQVLAKNLAPPVRQDATARRIPDNALVPLYVPSAAAQAAFGKYKKDLSSGSWRGLCLPWDRADTGHYGATKRALSELRSVFPFSPQAIGVVADASQDPDLFAWKVPAAHAQTNADDATGLASEDEATAKASFVRFVREKIDLVKGLCADGKPGSVRKALYWTGYALHAVQDLAPHRGRTNPEHAYNAEKEQNPDRHPQAFTFAVALSKRFLRELLAGELRDCAPKFRSYTGGGISFVDKVTTLQLSLDNSPAALAVYLLSADKFAPHQGLPAERRRWFGSAGGQPTSCTDKCDALLRSVVGR